LWEISKGKRGLKRLRHGREQKLWRIGEVLVFIFPPQLKPVSGASTNPFSNIYMHSEENERFSILLKISPENSPFFMIRIKF